MESLTDLRMHARQLELEAGRLQKASGRARAQARQDLRAGNTGAARLHAQMAVRAAAGAHAVLEQSAAVAGMAADVREAEATAELAATLALATRAMEEAAGAADLERLAAGAQQRDALRLRMAAAHELLAGGDGEQQIHAGADALLGQLETEMEMDAIAGLSVPCAAVPLNL
jgi:hypothetical protein